MCWFKEKFNPHLIDLDEYENNLIVAMHKKRTLEPVCGILGRTPDWTEKELAIMCQNRRMAQELYDKAKAGTL